jgi:polyvinyl alcohol dehydrogenase (cytochrome)
MRQDRSKNLRTSLAPGRGLRCCVDGALRGLGVTLVALGVLSVQAPAADTNWQTFHANAAREGNVESFHVPPLNLSWTAPGSNPASRANPAVDNGVVYTVAGGLVRARDALTGAQIWQHDSIGNDSSGSAPTVTTDGVYVVASTQQPDFSYKDILYKLAKTDGTTIWSRNPASFTAGYTRNIYPTLAGDKVIVVNADQNVVEAVNTLDGSLMWSTPLVQRFVGEGGAASGDKVFFPYTSVGSFGLLALNLSNGTEAWSRSMPSPGVHSVPLYLGTSNRLFVGTGDGNSATPGSMFALDASNGQTIWQVGGFDQIYRSTPTPASNNLWIVFSVYSLSSNNAVVALRTSDGSLIWQTPLPDRVATSVAQANGYVYVTSWDGRLRTIDVGTGSIVDNDVVGPPTDSISHPSVWGERVYVESAGTLYAFQGAPDPAHQPCTGTGCWHMATGLNGGSAVDLFFRFVSTRHGGVETVFAAVQGGTAPGLYKSTDGGEIYTLVKAFSIPYEVDVVRPDPTVNGTVYVATSQGLYRSGNLKSWTKVGGGLPANSPVTWVGRAELDFATQQLYATVDPQSGSGGLYRSLDGGANWTLVLPHADVRDMQGSGNTGLQVLSCGAGYQHFIWAANHAVPGGPNAAILSSSSGGDGWIPYEGYVPFPEGNGIALYCDDLGNVRRVYLTNGTLGSTLGAVWRSTDWGFTWASDSYGIGNYNCCGSDFPDRNINDVAIQIEGQRLSGGIFYKLGTQWYQFNFTGLTDRNILTAIRATDIHATVNSYRYVVGTASGIFFFEP